MLRLLVLRVKIFKFFSFLRLGGIVFEKRLCDKFSCFKNVRFLSCEGSEFVSLLFDIIKDCDMVSLLIVGGKCFVRLL